jgi:p21-activated kinase 1
MVKQQNTSRFSTLKVFNFAGGGGSKADSNNDSLSPPPPPPKDRYYMFNKSMSSLSPDSFSMPSTPLSTGFKPGGHSLAPSHSTMDLHEFGGSNSASGTSSKSSAPPKRSLFGKLASKSRRGLKPSSRQSTLVDDVHSQAPSEDDGISLPWNFQVSLLYYRSFWRSL